MKIAYLDMPSGVSGDMLLGALIDAGWPVDALRNTVAAMNLPADSWHVRLESVQRGALAATLVHVNVTEGDAHRHLSDIRTIIQRADLPVTVQNNAIAVFTRLAAAEAAVHGTGIEAVHFHEVGALDAIVDIVGVCAGLDALGIEQLYAGSFPLGEGWTQSAHGRIPLPAPATLKLLAAAGAATRPAPGPGELVTPTGAALVCALAQFRQPAMHLTRIGTGAGQKEFGWPNVLRLWLGDAADAMVHPTAPEPALRGLEQSALIELTTNIDDMNPEFYEPLQRVLFARGALDVWLTPVQMKKGRPGTVVGVLAQPHDEAALVNVLLRSSTTLGVRVQNVRRYAAERRFDRVETHFGPVTIKLKLIDGHVVDMKPEYAECLALAEAHEVPVQQVDAAARAAVSDRLFRHQS
ncbi:MAG: nickel pincer cofactor biosynthesis protein LarC [Caldilineaceae bacterium]|nr:nickel pincer cofactor biosynthesis protein LarC [Caldilineaceae bacterium]